MMTRLSITAICLLSLFAAAAPAGELVVELDADSYMMGDTVLVTVTNPTGQTVSCNSEPVFAVLSQDGTACYFGCAGLPVMIDIPPGGVLEYGYDTGFNPDPAGEYVVKVHESGTGSFPLPEPPRAYYTLVDPTPNEAEVWGGVKTLYR